MELVDLRQTKSSLLDQLEQQEQLIEKLRYDLSMEKDKTAELSKEQNDLTSKINSAAVS